MPRGGKRPNSGPAKGTKYRPTLEKEALRIVVRERIAEKLLPLVDAQIANAVGISYLVVREKVSGKFLRVGKGAAEKLNPSEEVIEIWEKDPSVQAFTDLLNRTIDKPADQVQAIEHSGSLTIKHELAP